MRQIEPDPLSLAEKADSSKSPLKSVYCHRERLKGLGPAPAGALTIETGGEGGMRLSRFWNVSRIQNLKIQPRSLHLFGTGNDDHQVPLITMQCCRPTTTFDNVSRRMVLSTLVF
jgi:hypothetical protein